MKGRGGRAGYRWGAWEGLWLVLIRPGDGSRLLQLYGYFDLSGSMTVIGLLTLLAVLDLSAFWSRLAC